MSNMTLSGARSLKHHQARLSRRAAFLPNIEDKGYSNTNKYFRLLDLRITMPFAQVVHVHRMAEPDPGLG